MSLLKNQGFNIVKVAINNAALITLQSVPVVLVPAQGAGKAIQVVGASVNYTFGGAAFGAANALIIHSASVATPATDYQAICIKILPAGANTFQQFGIQDISLASLAPSIIANDNLVVSADIDDATGTGNVDIYLIYMVINV